jgi:hypothetical protein
MHLPTKTFAYWLRTFCKTLSLSLMAMHLPAKPFSYWLWTSQQNTSPTGMRLAAKPISLPLTKVLALWCPVPCALVARIPPKVSPVNAGSASSGVLILTSLADFKNAPTVIPACTVMVCLTGSKPNRRLRFSVKNMRLVSTEGRAQGEPGRREVWVSGQGKGAVL